MEFCIKNKANYSNKFEITAITNIPNIHTNLINLNY